MESSVWYVLKIPIYPDKHAKLKDKMNNTYSALERFEMRTLRLLCVLSVRSLFSAIDAEVISSGTNGRKGKFSGLIHLMATKNHAL